MRRLRLAPSLAVSLAALVVAASTGAYAAVSSSATRITACVHHKGGGLYTAGTCARRDRRLTWNTAGPPGPAGPSTGPAGGALSGSYPNPTLATGIVTDGNVKPGSLTGASVNASTLGKVPSASNADTATNATNASNATNATTASSPRTLPSGKTLRGAFSVEAQAPAAGYWGNAYSFAFPLPSATAANYLAPGASSTAACPGTVSNPQAAPGYLCLYSNSAGDVGSVIVGDPETNSSGSASPYGFYIQMFATAAGLAYTDGTWAVTAP